MMDSEKLLQIKMATGWSQELLARELGVTFATLNSWINNRSKPREKASVEIANLFTFVIGDSDISKEQLQKAKLKAQECKQTTASLIENKAMVDKLLLELSFHTNAIEGSTMTLADVEQVVFKNKVLSNRTAIEQLEARNHGAALLWLLEELSETRWALNIESILQLHLRLMNGIVSDAGRFRRHQVRIANSKTVVANWAKVSTLMDDLISRTQLQPTDVIAELATFHSEFERIHPFSDGNGRVGRLLLLAMALHSGLTPPIIQETRKSLYYNYLELAQTEENTMPLQHFVSESIVFANKLLS